MTTASDCAEDSAVCVKRSDGTVQDLASIATQKLLLSGMGMCGYGHPSLPPSLHSCPHLSLLTLTASSIVITSYHLLITPHSPCYASLTCLCITTPPSHPILTCCHSLSSPTPPPTPHPSHPSCLSLITHLSPVTPLTPHSDDKKYVMVQFTLRGGSGSVLILMECAAVFQNPT